MLARLTRDLPRFLRSLITPDQASTIVRRRLETRAERFLARAERAIYGLAGSVRVRRQPPRATPVGKVLPFHVARPSRPD